MPDVELLLECLLWNIYGHSLSFQSSRFLNNEDIAAFWSRAQRSRIVYEILCTTPFGREKKGEVGVNSLVDQGAFSAAFPLHDVRFITLDHFSWFV